VVQLISNILNVFEEKIKNKKLTAVIEKTKDNIFIESDPFKLEQIIINLIDNAVKYTDKGEIKINIKDDNDYLYITVSDTGIGIPEKDISRIYERFYVVDKSRTKKSGGTGLGLSIVKHSVMLIGGEITLNSQLGNGTSFKIKLPKKNLS